MNKIGRKKCSMLASLLCASSWLLAYTLNPNQLQLFYGVSFLVGVTTGNFLVLLYSAHTCNTGLLYLFYSYNINQRIEGL